MKKLFTYLLILSSLAAFGQGRDLTITNTVKGYKAVTDTDFKRWSDSVAKATKAEALKVVQENISKATADAKAAAQKVFADNMKPFSTVEEISEAPALLDSVNKKVYQLSSTQIKGTEKVYVDGLLIRLYDTVTKLGDYTITSTGKITLKATQPAPAKWIYVYYQKVGQ